MYRIKKKRNWSTLLVSGSTAVFAIISLISVFISVSTWQTQREASRPYFTFRESPLVEITESLSMEFKFRNVGTHPATDLVSKTMVFNAELTEPPVLNDIYSVVNDIPRDTETSLLVNLDPLDLTPALTEQAGLSTSNISPYIVVISLQYADPILKDAYNQTIYMKWLGVANRKVQPLIHVESREQQSILKFLKDNNF
jgi:hypothetical protein